MLLIPALVVLAQLDPHTASATALATFALTGLFGTWLFQRRGSIDWNVTLLICAGAVVFSFIGAAASAAVSGPMLMRVIALLIIIAGGAIFFPPKALVARQAGRPTLERIVLLAVGALAGFGSGLSGAGGPLFSVPLMLMLGFAPLTAIGASQVLQIVAAAFGTAANLRYGSLDVAVAIWISVFELIGLVAGVRLAHRVPEAALRRTAASLCILVGGAMLLR